MSVRIDELMSMLDILEFSRNGTYYAVSYRQQAIVLAGYMYQEVRGPDAIFSENDIDFLLKQMMKPKVYQAVTARAPFRVFAFFLAAHQNCLDLLLPFRNRFEQRDPLGAVVLRYGQQAASSIDLSGAS